MDKDKFPYLYEIGDLTPDEKWEDCLYPGWVQIFKNICACINEVLEENGLKPHHFHIDQLKEKFGFGRCYWHLDDDCANEVVRASAESEIERLIEDFEVQTAHTCVECGQPSKYNSTGWILPYCESCALKAHNAHNQKYGSDKPFNIAFVEQEAAG